jgi:hypothetical protein
MIRRSTGIPLHRENSAWWKLFQGNLESRLGAAPGHAVIHEKCVVRFHLAANSGGTAEEVLSS